MVSTKPKVLFILGKGRSGSTLLDNVLGAVEGVFDVGEFIHLWDRALSQGWRCGCGVPVPECPTWREILEVARETGVPVPTVDRGLALDREVVRYWKAPRFFSKPPFRYPTGWRELDEWAEISGGLYQAIARVAGSDVIVDASKIPVYPPAFGLVPGIEPYVVQLVRDPRAVAYSWMRRRRMIDRDESSEMPRHGAVYSGATWTVHNLVAEAVRRRLGPGRSLLLRYEDLVREPRESLTRVLELVGAVDRQLPLVDERTATVGRNHSVGGNPNRLDRGDLAFREDVEWRNGLRGLDGAIVTALSSPLLRRYGYSSSTT